MIDEMLKLRVERALGHAADTAEVRVGAGDLRTLLRDLDDALLDLDERERRDDRVEELEAEVEELTAQVALQEEVIRETHA